MESKYLNYEWEESYQSESNSIVEQCNGRGRRNKKDYFVSVFVGFYQTRIKEIFG